MILSAPEIYWKNKTEDRSLQTYHCLLFTSRSNTIYVSKSIIFKVWKVYIAINKSMNYFFKIMKIIIIYFVSVSIYLNQSCDNYNYIQALTLAVLNIINPKDIGDSSKAAPFG